MRPRSSTGSSPLARGLPCRRWPWRARLGIIPARAGFTRRLSALGAIVSDHPRSRGVYVCAFPPATAFRGSSPLARGLLDGFRAHAHCGGIIPARAGFTDHRRGIQSSNPDHPRSRGVYHGPHFRPLGMAGSSPLARGLLERAYHPRPNRGIIPARAGFTSRWLSALPTTRDHPRSRGVYTPSEVLIFTFEGSSPLARGLPLVQFELAAGLRIIPARAGFTCASCTWSCRRADHPRSRGVYCNDAIGATFRTGSSPLARGLRLNLATADGDLVDHPRSRGVYDVTQLRALAADGSSPLARGLRDREDKTMTTTGIIPARAGFTAHASARSPKHWDHPRSRGVYALVYPVTFAIVGSSPLARGLHLAIGVIPTVGHPTRGRSPSLVT